KRERQARYWCTRTGRSSGRSNEARCPPLALRRHLAATKKIKVPDKGLGLHTLQADFAFLARTHSASPDHAVLSPVFTKLHVEQFPGQHLAHQSVNLNATRADVLYGGHLGKWQGVGIHAPQADRDESGDSCIAATIHAWIVRYRRHA